MGLPPLAKIVSGTIRQKGMPITSVARLSAIPLKTLHNWRSGKVATTKHWANLAVFADFFQMNAEESTELLRAGGHPPLAFLMTHVTNEGERKLLKPWEPKRPGNPQAQRSFPLRSTPEEFTGRTEEITDLVRASENSETRAIGVFGMGGIGKTALALRLANMLRAKYWNAQLDIDLRGRHEQNIRSRTRGVADQPLAPDAVMASVLRAFDPDTTLPGRQLQLQRMYRSALYQRRTLLLLDDAVDEGQVRALMPPEGSLAIVTSRNFISLPGMYSLRLRELAEDDARLLLLTLAPGIGRHADLIARRCGRLPLALVITAKTLRDHPDLSPAVHAKRLRASRRGAGLIAASFESSYQLLKPEFQAQLRLLSVFPGTFDLSAVASVLRLGPQTAQKAASRLILRSVVDRDETTRRYRIHDLVRSYVAALLDRNERLDAQKRHATFYQTVIQQASLGFRQDDQQRSLEQLDAEWHNIRAGQAWAAAHTEEDEAARICVGYVRDSNTILDLRLEPRTHLEWLESAQESAHRLGDAKTEAVLLRDMASECHDLGLNTRAINLLDRARHLFLRQKDQIGAATTLNTLGNIYASLGRGPDAVRVFRKALKVFARSPDRHAEQAVRGNLGYAYRQIGQLNRSILWLNQQLKIARQIRHDKGIGNALNNIALTQYELGNFPLAIQAWEQALNIRRKQRDLRGQGETLNNLGMVHTDKGEEARGIELLSQALLIARKIEDHGLEANSIGNLGLAHAAIGHHLMATAYFDQQRAISRSIQFRRGEANALKDKAESFLALGRPRQAMRLCEKALITFEAIEDPIDLALTLGRLGRANALLGLNAEASRRFTRALAIARKAAAKLALAEVLWLRAQAYKDLDRDEDAVITAKDARRMFLRYNPRRAEDIEIAVSEWQRGKSHGT